MAVKAKALKLKDHDFGDAWKNQIEDRWDYEDFKKDPHWCRDWISFDSVCYVEEFDTVYTGITSFAADIFRGYDRGKKQWVSTGYERIADPYDAKFHRS